ncbi:hypothetical protein ACH4E8_33550 [Streptomyces sp. NPDC017979]|uniref:hypothetical protein n=1 Tax=Streptomyces sp. NPDC017979 TaxID=3365024 RepID=UPI0037A398A0
MDARARRPSALQAVLERAHAAQCAAAAGSAPAVTSGAERAAALADPELEEASAW